jgi:hypothetical protein
VRFDLDAMAYGNGGDGMLCFGYGNGRAGDGNRTRMTSLEGVLIMAARWAELGGSLLPDGCS